MPSTPKSHIGPPVIHHGLYVMHEGLPVVRRLLGHMSVCLLSAMMLTSCTNGLPVMQRVCLSHAMTAIVIHACHNDIMVKM